MTTTGNVSLADLLNEIAEEVKAFVRTEADPEPVPQEAGDTVIADLSDNEDLKKLFWLKWRYAQAVAKYRMEFALFGELGPETDKETAAKDSHKAVIFDELFWSLARTLTNYYEPNLGIRTGFILVAPQIEQPMTKEALRGKLLAALRRGGQSALVN